MKTEGGMMAPQGKSELKRTFIHSTLRSQKIYLKPTETLYDIDIVSRSSLMLSSSIYWVYSVAATQYMLALIITAINQSSVSSRSPAQAWNTFCLNTHSPGLELLWEGILEQCATWLLFCLLLFHRRFSVDLSHQIIENLQQRKLNSLNIFASARNAELILYISVKKSLMRFLRNGGREHCGKYGGLQLSI